MRQLRVLPVWVCIAIMVVQLARAVGVSALDLDAITKDSDLIVVGEIVSVHDVGAARVTIYSQEYPARVLDGVLRADQSLKGALTSSTLTLRFYVPETYVGWKTLNANTYAAFFLKSGSGGDWEFTNPYYPSAPAVLGSKISGATAIEQVVQTIEAVIYSPTGTLNQRLEALQFISYSKSLVSTAALRSALNHTDRPVRLGSAAVLLHRNDSSGLALATDALLQDPSSTPEGIRLGLLAGIGTWLKQSSAVPYLIQLTRSQSPDTRAAAAEGLMHSGSPQAITTLLAMLGDTDRDVRYYSVVALAEITGQSQWRPNPDDFAAFGTRYVKHWIEWGATYRPDPQEPTSSK